MYLLSNNEPITAAALLPGFLDPQLVVVLQMNYLQHDRQKGCWV